VFGDVKRKGGGVRQADEVVIRHLDKIDLAAIGKISSSRRHQHQPVLAEAKPLEMIGQSVLGGKAEVGGTTCDRGDYIGAFAFLDIKADVGMFAQEGRERLWQVLRQPGGVGKQVHARFDAAGEAGKVAAHDFDIVHDEPGMLAQGFTGRGQLDAAAATLEECHAKVGFETLDPCACGRESKICAHRAVGDAAAVRHGDEKRKVNQIEAHGRSLKPCTFVIAEGSFNKLQIVPIRGIGQSDAMLEPILLFIVAAFLLAGFVKGVIGLGLPTVSVGLLAIAMPPSRAIAIVIVPAIITNIWQTFVGPYLRVIVRRLWPLMTGTAIGAWLNAGMLTGPYARYGTIVLGLLLVIYAAVGLRQFVLKVAPRHEKWVGGIVGVITGMISAATGVQVIPSMPFMQAIGMEKDELVQALGVFFTVATVALAFNLSAGGLLDQTTALPGAIAMVCSFAGMAIGQGVRTRMKPEVFRRWFLIAMIFLGIYLAGGAIYNLI
jgi:uncharacterized protein